MSGQFDDSIHYVIEHDFLIFVVVGRNAHQKLIEKHSQAVPIETFAMRFPLYDLRSCVGIGPDKRLWVVFTLHILFGEAEVCQFQMTFFVDDDVIWLQITVDDPFLM